MLINMQIGIIVKFFIHLPVKNNKYSYKIIFSIKKVQLNAAA